ncbi:NADH-quinone oxidoreductase subunit L [Mucilaginibacter sp. HMF5004]|uniref:NADH-quinone oxidoreductase subunit L n=1 Tax=Mucilaginibacter rivuli TaxID=2857527 RepID=UPI001C5F40BF|nr:NADH-quinone oxidoreductase subunit L [Mucilaginibacter rivuli]MBW4889647.1 NADH-quinone oxidoreductase subunit L [Mucilaginibacter rivuli]
MNPTLPHTDTLTIQLAIVAVLLPLAASLLNLVLVKSQSKVSGWLSSFAILGSMVLSVLVFAKVWNQPALHAQQLWFVVGTMQVDVGIWLNNLSVLMLLLVTAVALPVHVYSIAYLKGDDKYTRYFAYLSFFCFAMLALVIVDNLVLLYAFWELVGFASYLLIGFWFIREKAVLANKKAFIMNRIGDVALLTGILLLYADFHTFNLVTLFDNHATAAFIGTADNYWITLPGACFLIGAIAKSAQFPLHTWLPDAMEGPTSVSALIHAATMVAAGIFLLARVYVLFSPNVLMVMTIIGCFTAFMAATIALTQNDLKRILAYSTISQLGFMMMAMGVGAYSSALLHLAAHAFFKCLLFLSAGVIIHEMQHLKEKHNLDIDPQDINNMGGLGKYMPVTFITCIIASLALIGFPLTSGCLSKDGILVQAFLWADNKGGFYIIIPVMGVLTSLLTIFYISRLLFKVFLGKSRLKAVMPAWHIEAHDGSPLFKIPMIFLALCSLFPLFSTNPFEYEHSWIYRGFAIAVHTVSALDYHTIVLLSINVLVIPIAYFAYSIYVKQKFSFKTTSLLFKISFNEWYIDRFYHRIIVKDILRIGDLTKWLDKNVLDGTIHLFANTGVAIGKLTVWTDKYIIDGLITMLTLIIKQAGNFVRGFQTGRVQNYLFTMLLVIVVIYVLKTFI